MSQWEKFKKQQQNEDRPEGIMISGSFTCQFCGDWVLQGKYFPTESVLSFKCSNDHLSIIDPFKLSI